MAIDDNTSYELTGAQVKDLANKIKAKAADNIFVGATSAAPGSKGLVPQPQAGDEGKALHGDGTWKDTTAKLVEMSYGESSAWAKFIAAYNAGSIVYCRASSNANPATGSQTRKAFMAYVNNATSPTQVEFQYVRSVSSKSASQPVDQVFVYTLTNASGGTWSVQTRDMGPKLAAGTNTSVSYSSGTYTVSATDTTYSAFTGTDGQTAGTAGLVPAPATTDADKFLKSDGTWATAGGGGGGVVSFIATDMVMMKYPAVVQWMQQHSLNPSPVQNLNFSSSGGTFVLLNDAGTELAPVDAISEAFMQGSRILIKAMFMQYGGQMIQTASYNGSVLAADVITNTSTNYPFVFAFAQENMASLASTFSCKKQAQIGTYNNKTYATFQVAKSV